MLKVKFSKYFISGTLMGITVDCELSMPSMDSANAYMRFCHAHAEIPVNSLIGSCSPYVIFGSRIVKE